MTVRYEIWPGDTGYVLQILTDESGNIQSRQLVSVGAADNPPADAANFAALVAKARAAVNSNQTFLGINSPNNAQAVAQVQALTRQVDAIILYLLHELTGLATVPGT